MFWEKPTNTRPNRSYTRQEKQLGGPQKPHKSFFRLWELHLFFLLPFGFEFFILLCSTAYFIAEGGLGFRAQNSFYWSELLNNTTQNGKTTTSRWYQGKYLEYAHLIYQLLVGLFFLSYFKFFKFQPNSELWYREKQSNFSDYKLWFLASLIIPSLFTLLEIVKPSETSVTQFLNVIILFLKFASIYFYTQKSFSSLSSHFKMLYKNKENLFDSSRVNFFASRIFGILVLDIVCSILISYFLKLVLPKLPEAKNQEEIEKNISTMTVISVLFLAPFIEELVYRRTILKPSNFHSSTVATSSLIFGVIHTDPTQETIFHLAPYSLGGLIFSLTYKKFRNIWASIFVHFLHNLIALLISAIFK